MSVASLFRLLRRVAYFASPHEKARLHLDGDDFLYLVLQGFCFLRQLAAADFDLLAFFAWALSSAGWLALSSLLLQRLLGEAYDRTTFAAMLE